MLLHSLVISAPAEAQGSRWRGDDKAMHNLLVSPSWGLGMTPARPVHSPATRAWCRACADPKSRLINLLLLMMLRGFQPGGLMFRQHFLCCLHGCPRCTKHDPGTCGRSFCLILR